MSPGASCADSSSSAHPRTTCACTSAPVPGSSFFANGENRYIRLNFAKKPATLHAAGERLLKLKR